MIGVIAGEIIGSPYRKENVASATDLFFPIFRDVTAVDPKTFAMRTYRPAPGALTDAVLGRGLVSGDLPDLGWRSRGEFLVGAVAVGRIAADEGLSADLFAQRMDACAELAPENTRADVRRAGLSAFRLALAPGSPLTGTLAGARDFPNQETLVALLRGFVREGERGVYVAGDGRPGDGYALDAAFWALSQSRSWEETVRRAVALGGDSALAGALAGGLAELRYGGVPERIASEALTCLDVRQKDSLSFIERYVRGLSAVQDDSVREMVGRSAAGPVPLRVLALDGRVRVYAVGEDRGEIRERILKVNSDARFLDDAAFDGLCEKVSHKVSPGGDRLDGTTFVDSASAEVHRVWWSPSAGRLYSPSTLPSGEGFAPLEKRMEARSEFNALREAAAAVRDEQEHAVGFNAAHGHLRFATAWHIGIERDRVVLYRGGTAYGEFGLDGRGRMRVNTNVVGGSFGSEYLEAALDNRRVFYRSDGPAEIIAKLQEKCLDAGFIPDGEHPVRTNLELMQQDLLDAGRELRVAADVAEEYLPLRKADAGTKLRDDFSRGRGEDGEVRTMSRIVRSSLWQGAVFTVGTSNLTIDEFIANLQTNGITVVRDVRSYPHSKNLPQFDREALRESLHMAGIEYIYNGKEMGGHIGRKDFPSEAEGVVFTQSEGGYARRTRENAGRCDLTLAFAVDFDTAGERLTAQAAKGKIIQQPVSRTMSAVEAADDIYGCLSEEEKSRELVLNIAGNGMETFSKGGLGQEFLNGVVKGTLEELLRRGVRIGSVVSGGQTGADEAGILAAKALGIPAEVHAPKGWTMRGPDGVDVSSEYEFKSRFATMPSKCLTYEETARTREFRDTYTRIVEDARSGRRQALMCSETNPAVCHRFALLGYALEHPSLVGRRYGSTMVQHIRRDGGLVSQRDLEARLCRSRNMECSEENLPTLMRRLCGENHAPKPAQPKQRYAARAAADKGFKIGYSRFRR